MVSTPLFLEHIIRLKRHDYFRVRKAGGAIALAAVIASGCPARDAADKLTAPGRQSASSPDWGNPDTMDTQAVIEHTMRVFAGTSHPEVDTSTLNGKVMCGYQGWFTAEGDGTALGWT